MIKYLPIIFFAFIGSFSASFAQERNTLVGKIVSTSRDLEGIIVQNISSGIAVETEKGGYFNIPVQPKDTLMFSAVHMIGRSHIVKAEDIKKSLLFIPMDRNSTLLDEIYIDRSINSETLGFGKPRNYTPTQRNLITATTSGGGIIAVDALVNAISGRTKMLEQAVQLEQETIAVNRLLDKFPLEYFTDFLHIPQNYVQAFGYFIVDDSELLHQINLGNKNFIDFRMSQRATEFLQKLGIEKKK